MPKFLGLHSIGQFTEDELKKTQHMPRDEFGTKTVDIFYEMNSGIMFCLIEAPDRIAVESHHEKLGLKCSWITSVRSTASED